MRYWCVKDFDFFDLYQMQNILIVSNFEKYIYSVDISFHFILKFFKEGNPSAKLLVFKGPSN